MPRLSWPSIVERSAQIATEYDPAPTLRQVFYRLVSEEMIPNVESYYRRLSEYTAKARRERRHPPLTDGTRTISRPRSFTDPDQALDYLARSYRLDRTQGQEKQVWVIVEKDTLATLARAVTERSGVPVVALRGYGSQTIKDDIRMEMIHDGRPLAVVYLGDFDPSGKDIERDLRNRLSLYDGEVRRLAVTEDQITEMGLIPLPGKATDSRAGSFIAEHGRLFQVEVEAIPPDALTEMLINAVAELTNEDELESVLQREQRERETLEDLAP
jgi:hypothetical protein